MPHIFFVVGVLVVSTSAVLIRLAQPVAPITIAFGRVALAAVLLSALSGRQLSEIAKMGRRAQLITVVSGVALGLHFALWISSLELTSTAASVALVATQPIFAGLLGALFLGEGFRRQELWGIAVAAVGCAILAGGDFGGGSTRALLGDALSLAGAVAVCGYLLAGRALRDSIPLLPFVAAVNAVAALLLLVLALATRARFSGYAPSDYLGIVLLGLGPSVIGHTLINYCVRKVPVHVVSLGILAEPVAASLATWAIFAEKPTIHAAVGGAVIVLGVFLGFGLGARGKAPKAPG